MGESYMGLLVFANTCCLTAMSLAELKRTARAWNELLEEGGLRIVWEEASTYLSKVWINSRQSFRERNRGT